MRRWLLPVAAIALVAVVVVGLLQAGERTEGRGDSEPLTRREVLAPLEGAPPELAQLHRRAGELEPGGLRTLRAELRRLRGRPVVVNLWASWCGPCRFELPFFQEQAARRGKDIAFLGVNADDARAPARRFLEEFPVPYPSVEDPRSSIPGELGTKGLPATAFYDDRGRVAFVHQGAYPTERALSDAIDRYAPAT